MVRQSHTKTSNERIDDELDSISAFIKLNFHSHHSKVIKTSVIYHQFNMSFLLEEHNKPTTHLGKLNIKIQLATTFNTEDRRTTTTLWTTKLCQGINESPMQLRGPTSSLFPGSGLLVPGPNIGLYIGGRAGRTRNPTNPKFRIQLTRNWVLIRLFDSYCDQREARDTHILLGYFPPQLWKIGVRWNHGHKPFTSCPIFTRIN